MTGFGPFAGVVENPTQEVVEGLRQRAKAEAAEAEEKKKTSPSPSPSPSSFSLARSLVKTDVLRVSAADVERWVRVDLEEAARAVAVAAEAGAEARARAATAATDAAPSENEIHFVSVHLGVYPSATSAVIRLETRAHNSADFRVPDADGKVLLREAITKANKRSADERAERERTLESGLPLARVARRLFDPAFWTVATTDDAGRYLCNFVYWHSLCACRGEEGKEKKRPLLSSLCRPLLRLRLRLRGQRGGEEEEGRKEVRVVRHAVFVHLPPAKLLPVGSQLEFVERLLRVLAEELVAREEEEGK